MTKQEPLHEGHFYHVYNRGNNRENVFRVAENYRFFLQQYAQYIEPVAATYAYCLLPNHFHLLVYVRTAEERRQLSESWHLLEAQRAFKNLFISYAMAFNRRYGRSGSLFQKPFKRKHVDSDRYFVSLVTYIHRNPQLHGLIEDFREWPWSSYGTLLSDKPTRIQRAAVLEWFGNLASFTEAHSMDLDQRLLAPFLLD